ncbi:MAG TPA: hypothetical protein VHV54_24910 [Candidatus Binatia bacterium]|nr:hypothetical protein [Candidatus Binatia bacterium]
MNALGMWYDRLAQFHENERLIAWLQSFRLVHWLNAERRRQILFIGAIFAGVVGTFSRQADWHDYRSSTPWLVHGAAFLLVFGIVYSLYLAAIHFRRLPALIRRRPQICFHFFFWAILLIIWFAPEKTEFPLAVLIVVAASFPYLIWRVGYMLLSGQRGRASGSQFRDHLYYIWPVWDGTNTPPGKGYDHLSRAEAQTPEAYARAILGGIKLLLLVALWKIVMQIMGALIYGDPRNSLTHSLNGLYLGIPRLKQILGSDASTPLLVTWISLYLELIWETLFLAVKGHVWVGVLRLFGFNVFRNTYKPLLAETLVEFWNRYYYYFKELMMEFFFFPAYVRYFRDRPALRIIVAVFAAAFVGNMYYHLLQAKDSLIAANVGRLWTVLGPRLIYCFLLASGIAISMLRQQKLRGRRDGAAARAGGFPRVWRIACVWTFFAIINFWNVLANLTIAERGRLFLSLFGL